ETIAFLTFSGRDPERVKLVEAYAKAQGMWRDASSPDPIFTDALELDLADVEPSLAGPRRPQDRVALSKVATEFEKELATSFKVDAAARIKEIDISGTDETLQHGDVVIAAITSCTNTSNPGVMLAAGLVAKKALAKGLK